MVHQQKHKITRSIWPARDQETSQKLILQKGPATELQAWSNLPFEELFNPEGQDADISEVAFSN